jgi:protein-S-isoprenylcysteine O-methyltransferase Ste14
MSVLENRIPPPLAFLATAGLMWFLASMTTVIIVPPWLRYLITGVLLIGALVAPWAILAFRKAVTTIDPLHIERASALVTTGPFALTRNPMYLGLTLLLLAWAVILSAPWVLIGPIAFVLFITRFQIIPEERAMLAKFGAAYEEYQRRVRRWI